VEGSGGNWVFAHEDVLCTPRMPRRIGQTSDCGRASNLIWRAPVLGKRVENTKSETGGVEFVLKKMTKNLGPEIGPCSRSEPIGGGGEFGSVRLDI